MIDCDYKKCDRHPGDGECNMVGIYIDEDGRCGKMFPAIQADKPVDKCNCRFSDAWRCAKDQNLVGQIACYCKCHQYI